MNQTIIVPVGIDWADAKHAFHIIGPAGQELADQFDQDPQAIAAQIEAWRKLFPGVLFAVAIEASKGAIINALLEYHDVQIYPVNPAALANYRKAFAHGGGKNDPVDAKLLAQFIDHYREQLKPLKPNQELTRKIAAIAEDRRRLVDQRADMANELTALLKRYFPAALALKPARSYSEFFLKFLQKHPSLGVGPGCWSNPPEKLLSWCRRQRQGRRLRQNTDGRGPPDHRYCHNRDFGDARCRCNRPAANADQTYQTLRAATQTTTTAAR